MQEYEGTYSTCSPDEGSPYATTLYEYDVLGHLLRVSDALNNQTEMHYDTLGRKVYMKDPDMGVWTYYYDANGNLKGQSDAKFQSIIFTYDELNRLKTKTFAGTLAQTNYYDETTSTNSVGRLSRTTDATGQTVYNYDIMGRVTSIIKIIDGVSYKIIYGYLNGRLDSITYPDNEKIHYSYDAGYLKGPDGYINYSDFDAQGRPKNAAYGSGGANSLYSYYPDTQMLHTITVASPTQGVLIDNVYAFDNKGNVKSITDNLSKTLSSAVASEVYTMDGSRAHAVGSTDSGRIFLYDANGNVTSDGSRTISYNFENMPTQINTTGFTYDGSSTRVKKISPAGTTVYIGKLYECTNGVCTKYIYAGNSMVASKSGSQILFFHPDHQGSTSVVTDALGNKVGDSAYLPFGATRQESGLTSVKYKYTGQEQDKEIGLYNYNARLYDPDLGRFLTPDTIVPDPTNPQGLNRYSYVINNPLNFTDPTGHGWFSKTWNDFKKFLKTRVNFNVEGSIVVTSFDAPPSFSPPPVMVTGNTSTPSSGGGSSSNNNSSGNPGTASNGVPIGNTGINYVGPGSGAWSGGYNYGYPPLSLGFGDIGSPSSFTLANAVRTATTEGYNAAQVATQGAWVATRGIATDGPPVAQATLALATYFMVGPFAGPLATSSALLYPLQFINSASSLGLPPSQPPSIFQGGISVYSLYDDWMSYRAK